MESPSGDEGTPKLVAKIGIDVPVINPVLDVRVDIAIVDGAANEDGVGFHDVEEGDVGGVAEDNVAVNGTLGVVSNVSLEGGVDSGSDGPGHFGNVGVVLWSVDDEDGDVGGSRAAVEGRAG